MVISQSYCVNHTALAHIVLHKLHDLSEKTTAGTICVKRSTGSGRNFPPIIPVSGGVGKELKLPDDHYEANLQVEHL